MKMIKDFTTYSYIYDLEEEGISNKKVKAINVKLVADNLQGRINITDIQLQSGGQQTGYNPTTQEFMEEHKHTIDEFAFINTVSNPVKEGVQPKLWKGVNNRIFNMVGRGHETISVSNTYHDDYTMDMVVCGLDLTIIPKDDYDLLRISTNDGIYVENRVDHQHPCDSEYPLNYIYTNEYYFAGGKAGDKIELLASKQRAYKNGIDVTEGKFVYDGIPMATQSYMVCCQGSNRYRIEFYKRITETDDNDNKLDYYKDTGIGFYGWAEIPKQYTMGVKI